MGKIERAMDALETTHADQLAGSLTIGQIAVGCALGWFDFRYGHVHWRQARPKLAAFIEGLHARPSFKATVPVG